jgi:hypothetical protein
VVLSAETLETDADLMEARLAAEDWEGATGLVQAAEVDGALGVQARLRIVATSGDQEMVCSRAADISRLWVDPDDDLTPLVKENEDRLAACPP